MRINNNLLLWPSVSDPSRDRVDSFSSTLRLELLPGGLDESLADGRLLDAVGFLKTARHQRVVPRGQAPQHLPPDLVVQVARLLEQFVRSHAHFAVIFAAQSLTLQGHFLSIHHDEAMKKPYQIAAGRTVQRVRQWAEEKSPVVQLVLPMIEILTLAILAEYNAAPSAGNVNVPFTVTQVVALERTTVTVAPNLQNSCAVWMPARPAAPGSSPLNAAPI